MSEIRIGAEQFRRQLTDWLSRVGYGADHVIIERHGSPVAALVPFDFYEQATIQAPRAVRERRPSYTTNTDTATVLKADSKRYEQNVVLTLNEAAEYLQLSVETVTQQAEAGQMPGRRIDNTWRFLKAAIDTWLYQDSRQLFLQQAGAFADDETLPLLLQQIYEARGRYEVDPDDGNEHVNEPAPETGLAPEAI
jgi:prevent-host-death family protein